MKVIICGSRTTPNYEIVQNAIQESGFEITEVFSGTARGADKFGESWALANNIPIKRFIPKWDEYGKKAGILRNLAMIEHADAVIAIWDGKSKGTKHCFEEAKKRGLNVFVKKYVDGTSL